jgi:LysR family transcriptional regulator, transcriptional activator of nhaA
MYVRGMEWLNYHHLLYFWTVAREGTVARACARLHLAQPTISGQLRQLERDLGVKLFERAGRHLVLTPTGQEVYRRADEIFGLGRDLLDVLRGRLAGRPTRLLVGVAEDVPELIAYRVVEPALRLAEPVQVICHREPAGALLAELALHRLDVVLANTPVGPADRVRAFSHPLGESGVSLCGTAGLVGRHRRDFPHSLDGAPFLLPLGDTSLRRALDEWFEAAGLRPLVVGEFADRALLRTFAQAGAGFCAVPTAVEAEVRRQYRLRVLGRLADIKERFFLISTEKKLRHPAVAAMAELARETVFRAPS